MIKKPIKIERVENKFLKTIWNDGFESKIKIEVLRKECPCANCREEREKNSNQKFIMLNTFKAGEFELKEIISVGNYAITPIWGDGHDTGIYSWDMLREIFEKNNL
jgi:DUF971 family protein